MSPGRAAFTAFWKASALPPQLPGERERDDDRRVRRVHVATRAEPMLHVPLRQHQQRRLVELLLRPIEEHVPERRPEPKLRTDRVLDLVALFVHVALEE